MRFLSVSPYPVYPPTFGGQARIFNIAKSLVKEKVDVTILSNTSFLFGNQKNKIVNGVKLNYARTYFQDIAGLLFTKKIAPLIISYPFNTLYGYWLRSKFKKYDVVQFEQPFLAGWLRFVPNKTIKIYASQNVEIDFEPLQFEAKFLNFLYKGILSYAEKYAIEKADMVTCCSEFDRQKLISIYDVEPKKIYVVENGFETADKVINKAQARERLGIPKNIKVAVFVGSISKPNVEAVQVITEKIAPLCPEMLFLLLGESSYIAKKNTGNIKVVGGVKNLSLWMQVSDVGLLPMIHGSGTSLKLLEYLKYGLPVISTKIGARGYNDLLPYITIAEISNFSEKLNRQSTKHLDVKQVTRKYKWNNLAKKLLSFIEYYDIARS